MVCKNIRCYVLSFVLLFFTFSIGQAQQKYFSKSKKAIKFFESAYYQYNLKNFSQAKQELEKALEIDKNFLDVYILLGEISNEEEQKQQAIEYYIKAISIDKEYNPLMYLRKADLERETGKYAEAKADYELFISLDKKSKDYISYANEKIRHCLFAIELLKKPVKFEPVNLGPDINTSISEYWPSLTADDSTLTYTSSDRLTNSQEDLYFSTKHDGKWQQAVKIGSPINTVGSEGAQCIAADGKTMVFTACLRPDGFGSCDLYISYKKGNKWTAPANMGQPVNSSSKESQPSISADGKTLYFVSNRSGGKGKFDIWKSTLLENKKWGNPVNLGDSINTTEDELAPFIHYDNQTLYFSSEGHPGMGGSDLFISKMNQHGEWSKARNLGYPVNTCYHEESLIVTSDGIFGLFSSDMKGGYGQKDIYQFEMPLNIKPGKVIFVKGLVYNAKTKQPLGSIVEINNLVSGKISSTESDESSGEFLTCLEPNNQYAFNVNKKGYLIYSETLILSDSSVFVKIPLEPIGVGVSAILKNIFFEYNSYQLKKESVVELEQLKNFLISNNLSVELQGHTDNEGTAAYNKQLSNNRAKAVYDYLIKAGIAKEKLQYKGFGFEKPIANNDTDLGRAKNRRTEFKIISINK